MNCRFIAAKSLKNFFSSYKTLKRRLLKSVNQTFTDDEYDF